MSVRAAFGLLLLAVTGARLCHVRILWIEECYPAAAAIQVLNGKVPYRDFWYDKPPLSLAPYLLWGAYPGWLLRLAGAAFVLLVCWLLYCSALAKWSRREALTAAFLGAFFLTFGLPSAVMALAPDLLLAAPHLAAVCLAWQRRPFWCGFAAGVALLVHAKGVFVLAACLLWSSSPGLTVLGFLTPSLAAAAVLGLTAALGDCWQQVWQWGLLYSRDTFLPNPAFEGLRRTLNWAGFHATLVLGSVWFWRREPSPDRRRFALWGLISLAAVAAGWRFFPRYYFQLLPVMALAGARGLCLMPKRHALAVLLLLTLPLARFGPRYVSLAADLITGQQHRWDDLAMYQGSQEAAQIINSAARPGDSLLVWGYRPDIFVLTRLPAGTRFLDSQPLTGVIADRHLFDSRPAAPELAARNRRRLAAASPTFIVDGLGPYNPSLAIDRFPELGAWLGRYRQIARTPTAIILQRQ